MAGNWQSVFKESPTPLRYKYIDNNGFREHYIANMDDSKHLLLKNIIEMETLIYKNNLDSNKSEDISELIHSYFLVLINYTVF